MTACPGRTPRVSIACPGRTPQASTFGAGDAGPALRASLSEQLTALRGDAPDALTDAVLGTVELPGGPLWRVRPRSFDAVREAEALAGAGRPTPYWASAWPSGIALARAVAAGPGLAGRRVLEVGCGLGLAAAAAARAGAEVLATDRAPEAVVYAAHNLALNDLRGDVAATEWERADALGDAWDLLLGADVLYTFSQAESLQALVDRVIAPGGELWIADPGRAGCKQFLQAVKAQWLDDPAPDAELPEVIVHRLRRRVRRGR